MSNLSSDSRPELSEPLADSERLIRYFHEGAKDPGDLQAGVEWEKIGVFKESGRAIPYSGPRGVEAIFGELARGYGWMPEFVHDRPLALHKDGSSITLEPGGQIELSGRKARTIDENADELYSHLSEIQSVSSKMGIVWLGTGLQPVSGPDEIEWVPKERYAIMRKLLVNGRATQRMMKQTASIQIALDYTGERDAMEKLRLASALTPVLTALFGNSPISEGKPSGVLSERALIWLETAPERSGAVPDVFRDGYGFAEYVAHLLTVPALFILRGGRWISLEGMPFGEFMRKGFEGHRATLADWELHLTTLFTDARLKNYVEIRSVDCQKTEIGLSVPAFMKGLFYDEDARAQAWEILKGLSPEERVRLTEEAARKGMSAAFGKSTLLTAARALVRLAGEGLQRLADGDPSQGEDLIYLEPLLHLVLRGKSPAELLLERLSRGASENRLAALLDYAAIA